MERPAACLYALPKGGVRVVQASGGCPGFRATVQSEGTHTDKEVQVHVPQALRT